MRLQCRRPGCGPSAPFPLHHDQNHIRQLPLDAFHERELQGEADAGARRAAGDEVIDAHFAGEGDKCLQQVAAHR